MGNGAGTVEGVRAIDVGALCREQFSVQPVEFGIFSHVSLPERSTRNGGNELLRFRN